MTTFKPGRLAVLALPGVTAPGSTACACDPYRDHHHRDPGRGGHAPLGDHGPGRHHGDHRNGH